MTAEQQAAPEQPDLHQRIDATIRPRMLIGLQDAELYDEPGRERIGEWADSITSWVMAEIEPELTKRQERGDIWKAKAAEMEQDRDRLDAELAALREQLAAVDTALRAVGIEHPLGAAGVRDLAAMANGTREEFAAAIEDCPLAPAACTQRHCTQTAARPAT